MGSWSLMDTPQTMKGEGLDQQGPWRQKKGRINVAVGQKIGTQMHPGKWKQWRKLVVTWWCNFDPYPCIYVFGEYLDRLVRESCAKNFSGVGQKGIKVEITPCKVLTPRAGSWRKFGMVGRPNYPKMVPFWFP